MKYRKLQSFGIIPVRLGDGGSVEMLLVNQKQGLSDYWSFPKGAPEAKETPTDTALRETKEETNIDCRIRDSDTRFVDRYTVTREGKVFEKTVTYFVGTVSGGVAAPQQGEIDACEWLQAEDARERLTFGGVKHLLDDAMGYIARSRLLDSK